MPDWLSHLGSAYFLKKSFKKSKRLDTLFFILWGSILPDLISRVFYVFFDLFFSLGDYFYGLTHIYFELFHTPFQSILLSLWCSLFFTYWKKPFLLMSLFAIFHILLDALQKKYTGSSALFYPLSLARFDTGIFWYRDEWFFIPVGLTSFFLLRLQFKKKWIKNNPIYFIHSALFVRRFFAIFILFFIILLLPLSQWERAYRVNFNEVAFIQDSTAFIDCEVSLVYSKLLAVANQEQEWKLKLWEGYRLFEIAVAKDLALPALVEGKWYSVKGIWDGQQIIANEIILHSGKFKTITSLLALCWLFIWSIRILRFRSSH